MMEIYESSAAAMLNDHVGGETRLKPPISIMNRDQNGPIRRRSNARRGGQPTDRMSTPQGTCLTTQKESPLPAANDSGFSSSGHGAAGDVASRSTTPTSPSSPAHCAGRVPGTGGLVNHQSTCFANAVVQCLSNTPAFVIRALEHRPPHRSASSQTDQLSTALCRLLQASLRWYVISVLFLVSLSYNSILNLSAFVFVNIAVFLYLFDLCMFLLIIWRINFSSFIASFKETGRFSCAFEQWHANKSSVLVELACSPARWERNFADCMSEQFGICYISRFSSECVNKLGANVLFNVYKAVQRGNWKKNQTPFYFWFEKIRCQHYSNNYWQPNWMNVL